MEVRAERSGWRDEGLSRRHREWGWNCPAVDVDFLMLEYNRGEPIALVEYKHERAAPIKVQHPTFRALRALADNSQIPFLYVRYADDFSWFKVAPLNDFAEAALELKRPSFLKCDEKAYVAFLYSLRGLSVAA